MAKAGSSHAAGRRRDGGPPWSGNGPVHRHREVAAEFLGENRPRHGHEHGPGGPRARRGRDQLSINSRGLEQHSNFRGHCECWYSVLARNTRHANWYSALLGRQRVQERVKPTEQPHNLAVDLGQRNRLAFLPSLRLWGNDPLVPLTESERPLVSFSARLWWCRFRLSQCRMDRCRNRPPHRCVRSDR